MKKKVLFIIPICICILAAGAISLLKNKPARPVLHRVEVPTFPVMQNPEPESKDPNMAQPESHGEMGGYTIHADNIYYIVGYPFDEGLSGYYRYISVFRQPLSGGELEKVIDRKSDKWMIISNTNIYYDEKLWWIEYGDDGECVKCTLNGDYVEEEAYAQEEPPEVEDVVKGYDVDADTLDGLTWVCHENETYVVWGKWPQHGDSSTSIGSTTNVLNKKTGEVTVIQNSDYCEGSLKGQVLYGDYLFFYVYHDEQVLTGQVYDEDYLFNNNYMFDLKTGQATRLTENRSGMIPLSYHEPILYENGICFMSDNPEEETLSGCCMYYMEMN